MFSYSAFEGIQQQKQHQLGADEQRNSLACNALNTNTVTFNRTNTGHVFFEFSKI